LGGVLTHALLVWESFDPGAFCPSVFCPGSVLSLGRLSPVWARGRCRISPPRFLAECFKRQLNQVSFVVLYFKLSTFLICIEFVYLYFPVLFCLSVSVK